MAYIVMAYKVMAYIFMAYIAMAYKVMAYIVMAAFEGLRWGQEQKLLRQDIHMRRLLQVHTTSTMLPGTELIHAMLRHTSLPCCHHGPVGCCSTDTASNGAPCWNAVYTRARCCPDSRETATPTAKPTGIYSYGMCSGAYSYCLRRHRLQSEQACVATARAAERSALNIVRLSNRKQERTIRGQEQRLHRVGQNRTLRASVLWQPSATVQKFAKKNCKNLQECEFFVKFEERRSTLYAVLRDFARFVPKKCPKSWQNSQT